MANWLRPLLMMFYAPRRGMAEVRDRAPLGSAMLLALLAQLGFITYTLWAFLSPVFAAGLAPFAVFEIIKWVLLPLLLVAVVFVPALVLLANLFERRASFGIVLQQEYAPLAAAALYAWAAANLIGLPLAALARASGFEADVLMRVQQSLEARLAQGDIPLEDAWMYFSAFWQTATFAVTLLLPFFIFWLVVAVHVVFRLSVPRSILVTLLGGAFTLVAGRLFASVFGMFLGAPFWLIFILILLRGYFGEVTRGHRARASFKQNLEAATLNPADASAHYNLGLIYQQRGQFDEARKSFERAVEIDAEEVDAHYQLGRIAREQGRLGDAINHFSEVVSRDTQHSQHEIWRETGATYLAAGQFEDAREALSRFLENRNLDPQGLYLMGRALAGLGRQREAADSMQACIEAVKTAPAYKYRTEKRWLNEAQQFLRSQA
ncbi:MAG TPA: tetratricopeptide repeat protein [Pyrinomonadaceae bacterium]|nr:tetratricopeptide repeat protein [Pyrinomonadaceae bacterium]